MNWRYSLAATVLVGLGLFAINYFLASSTMLTRVIAAGIIGGSVFYVVGLVEQRNKK